MTTADPKEIFGDLLNVKDDVDYSVFTPEMIEQEVLRTAARLEESPKFIKKAHNYWANRRQEYLQAHAQARRQARIDGVPSTDRKAEADLATMDLLVQMDDAKVLYDYVIDLEKSLSKKLSSLQSTLRSQGQVFGSTR
jgi:hypothetical protein